MNLLGLSRDRTQNNSFWKTSIIKKAPVLCMTIRNFGVGDGDERFWHQKNLPLEVGFFGSWESPFRSFTSGQLEENCCMRGLHARSTSPVQTRRRSRPAAATAATAATVAAAAVKPALYTVRSRARALCRYARSRQV